GILDQSGVDQPFDSLSDVVRLQDWLDTDNRIETMRLADGSTLDLNGLVAEGSVITVAGDWNGNWIGGGQGDDALAGSAGDDILIGSGGADDLRGGGGNDMVVGGAGDDVYRIGRGDGADALNNIGEGASNDRVQFDAGVDPDQLWFARSGDDLSVSIIGTNDGLTIVDWYLDGGDNQVAGFDLSDRSVLLGAQVENLVSAMSAYSPPSLGETELSQALHDGLDQTIADNWQST
ncbi:MAG: calcium-binding protein, partial [Rhodospirillales bacterium]|nr:calcium-binding protein [Rhodospirillales bacterium]